MRQEQFNNKFKQAGHSAQELDRKWRLYLEQKENDELMEMAQQQYTAANAPAGLPGGGGSNVSPPAVLTDYYTFNVNFDDPADGNSVLVRLASDGTSEVIPLENEYKFYGYTVFTDSSDDATRLYFVSQDQDAEEMVFGRINIETGEVEEITRDFPVDTYAAPNSLWYIGGNTFHFLTESYFVNGSQVLPKVISLDTQGSSAGVALTNPEEYSIQAMFPYVANSLWGIVSPPSGTEAPPFPYIGILTDVEGVLQLNQEPDLITLEGAPQGPSKPIIISGLTVNDELEIIVNMVYGPLEEEASYVCLARLDIDTTVATYLQPIESNDGFTSFGVATFSLPQNT